MNRCPFCHTEIEENARFCLYCMKPLSAKQIIERKKKRSYTLLAVCLGVLVIGVAVLLLLPGKQSPSVLPTSQAELHPHSGTPGTENYRTRLADTVDADFFPAGSDVCWYRECTSSEFSDVKIPEGYMAELPEGHVACGIYSIRDSLHGTKVVAIGSAALPDDVVMLTVPRNVVYIAPYALSRCVELKYLCLEGEQIRFDASIFPPVEDRWYQIVIRCSPTCKNDQGEYIKEIADRYGALWEPL